MIQQVTGGEHVIQPGNCKGSHVPPGNWKGASHPAKELEGST